MGGRTVGVSPGANIYGVKVLSDDGSGDVSAILAALDFVRTRVASTGRRSVVSHGIVGEGTRGEREEEGGKAIIVVSTISTIFITNLPSNFPCYYYHPIIYLKTTQLLQGEYEPGRSL